MLTRRAVLGSLAAGAAASIVDRGFSAPVLNELSTRQTLGSTAAARDCLYGCAAATYELKDNGFAPVLAREAKILVAEYEMKRGILQPQPDAYDFEPADALLKFSARHGMAFRGHTLVWHKANPRWLADALSSAPSEALLTAYIAKVAGRYRGKMHSWDVVNEALAPAGDDNLRQSLWLKAFGPSYIDVAFHAARAADPNALLVYNDWGCESDSPEHDRFRAATLDFLERAKARGVPIDAYGMQGHLQAFGRPVNQRKLREFIDRLRALKLKILVTEHDVEDGGGPTDVVVRDRAVADASRRFLDAVLDSSATLAVLTWGLSDRFLDPPGLRATLAGYSPRMLPLDANFARKPLWASIAASFSGRRPH